MATITRPTPATSRAPQDGPVAVRPDDSPTRRGRIEASLTSRLLSLAFLVVVVLAPPASLAAAGWVAELDSAPRLALVGLVVGLIAARARLSGLLVHSLGLIVGFEANLVYFARLMDAPDWQAQLNLLGGRVNAWLEAAASGGASNDTLMFALTMSALAYVLGYFSAWLVFRSHAAWLAIVPNGATVLLNLSFASPDLMPYFFVYLIASLLLLVSVDQTRRELRWAAAGVPFQRGLHGLVYSGAAVAVAAVIGGAWLLPVGTLSDEVARVWSDFTAPWQSVESHFDRLFASVQGSERSSRGLAFGRTLAPRGAFELGQQPVLLVSAPGARYWRARTFDRYTGQVMVGSETESRWFDAEATLPEGDEQFEARAEFEQRVRIVANQATMLFAAESPLRASVPVSVETRARTGDVDSLRLAAPLRRGQEYTVVSLVSQATAEQLRNAGTDYPPEVRSAYLQLPRRLPLRVREETRRITSGAGNPYEAALAVESYLRSMTYSTHVPMPPPDRDWVDYLLFDSREGYCDYYATAMAVMLRSIGIPARVATGFAPGEYDEASGYFVVRESHAHSWTEVYFPHYGWITFEPSALRPVPARPESSSQPSSSPNDSLSDLGSANLDELTDLEALRGLAANGDFGSSSSGGSGLLAALRTLAVALAALGGIAGLVLAIGAVAWHRGLRGLSWYQRTYAQLGRLARWCGLRPRPSQTPYEFAAAVAEEVPPARPYVETIADLYVVGTYGGRRPDATLQQRAGEAWRAVRLAVPRTLLRRRLERARALLAERLRRR